jgi:hypothetical protein
LAAAMSVVISSYQAKRAGVSTMSVVPFEANYSSAVVRTKAFW